MLKYNEIIEIVFSYFYTYVGIPSFIIKIIRVVLVRMNAYGEKYKVLHASNIKYTYIHNYISMLDAFC